MSLWRNAGFSWPGSPCLPCLTAVTMCHTLLRLPMSALSCQAKGTETWDPLTGLSDYTQPVGRKNGSPESPLEP